MRKHLMVILTALAASTLPGATATQQPSTKLGMLDCVIEGGTGFIIGSTKDLACTFRPANNKVAPEAYVGVVKKFGLDVGGTKQAVLQWLVFAPTEYAYDPGALAGNYAGVGAEATVVVGAGANLLVGGSEKTFTLQPLSVQAQSGLNVAAGVTSFQLRAAQ
jgi:Protein of unknown function (DUF992)